MVAFPSLHATVTFGTTVDVTSRIRDDRGGQTARGRNYETDTIEPGAGHLTLDNTDGALTPGNAASAYTGYVIPRRQVTVTCTPPGGVSTPLFAGEVESWSTVWPGGTTRNALSDVPLLDALSRLSRTTLKSAMWYERASNPALPAGDPTPTALYPLAEVGPTYADLTGTWPAAYIAPSGYSSQGAGWSQVTSPVPGDAAGNALSLGPVYGASATSGGFYVRLPNNLVPVTADFSLEICFQAPPSTPFGAGSPSNPLLFGVTGSDTGELVRLEIDTSSGNYRGQVYFLVGDGTGPSLSLAPGLPGGNGVLDGDPHHIVATYKASTGAATLTVDGVTFTGTPTVASFSYPAKVWTLGGYSQGAGNNLNGTVSWFAVYSSVLTALQISSRYKAFTGNVGEKADARIGRVLRYVYGTGGYTLYGEAGISPLGPVSLAGQTALAAVQDAALADGGTVFAGADGRVKFQNRQHRWLARSPVWIFDVAFEQVRGDLTFTLDDQHLANVVTVTSSGNATGLGTNSTSVTTYGQTPLALQVTLNADRDVQNRADWEAGARGTLAPRTATVSIDVLTGGSSWAQALGIEIGDRVQLLNLPANAPAAAMDFFVERVQHDWKAGPGAYWTTSLALSPADTQVLVWDDTTWDDVIWGW